MVDRLHPSLRQVLAEDGWSALSEPQEAAWDVLVAGRHALVVAPTGSGKTEAALLPVLHRLLTARDDLERRDRPWPTGFKALYVTPLRALNRDLEGRLRSWAERLGLSLGVRHGDTSQAERARQARKPPDLLITTPETVQLLLFGDTLRRHLNTVRAVVVDEVHDLAASERGAQLMVALERIEEAIAQPESLRLVKAAERTGPTTLSATPDGAFQRIGLSATVAAPDAVAGFLGGARDVEVVVAAGEKERRLDVIEPDETEDDAVLGAELALPSAAVAQLRVVRDLVQSHERVLVFSNTRDGAELLANRSAMLDERDGHEPVLGLHHGSLSAEHRARVEDDFKQGRIRALVATSSLELGIDVGAIDHVVQVGSPRSVARLMQRLGRAGHRIGAVSEGTLVASDPEEAWECRAIARRAEAGDLEPLRLREAPLVVLANQLVALSNEYAGLDKAWTYALLQRSGPFQDLDEGLFEQTWETLLEVKTLYEADDRPGRIGRSGRGRKHFLDHVSLIPDQVTYRVMDEATKRSVGTVDDGFIAAGLHPGAGFIMAGRAWRVLEVDADAKKVRVAPAKDLAGAPQWSGSELPVSFEVAQDTARLRGELRDGPVGAQVKAGLRVPTDRLVALEQGRGGVVAHVALGTRGNEALGRITAGLLEQRLGRRLSLEHDAYRIRFGQGVTADAVEDTWRSLDPETLDLLLAVVLREAPVVRTHLVHVAKQFGALPKALDPTRTTRKTLDGLWARLALQEETLNRLAFERFDLDAVQGFLRDLAAGTAQVVHQGMGPLAQLGQAQRMVVPHRDDKLLAQVRRRIEASDVLLVCTNCRTRRPTTVAEVPRQVRCRRCQSQQVACLRPWDEERLGVLKMDRATMDKEQLGQHHAFHRNAALLASFGSVAARCLVARGVGPSTAVRILQKTADIESRDFWRELLQAELDFARTSAFWK